MTTLTSFITENQYDLFLWTVGIGLILVALWIWTDWKIEQRKCQQRNRRYNEILRKI